MSEDRPTGGGYVVEIDLLARQPHRDIEAGGRAGPPTSQRIAEAWAKVRLPLDPVTESCARCAEAGRTCPSCVQRRLYAWSLVTERGETFETAGRIMKLAPERVRELVGEEGDRCELNTLRCNSIPVLLTQSVIADALARDPDLTIGEIAHWLDMRQADFERAYLGKANRGRPKRRVNVANASRLMIALGRAPNELEGC